MDETIEPVLVRERHGAVVVLRLNRPEQRNALTPELVGALGSELGTAEADDSVRCVVLTGTGDRAFCAGMDLKAFASGDQSDGDTKGAEVFGRFIRCRVSVPVVGGANATAVAGGFELLLGCDVVVASEGARFGLPEVKRGLFAAGGGVLLGQRIPLAVALELTLTGDLVDAERARMLGPVNQVVPADEVLGASLELAARIAANGPLAVQATKELVRIGATNGDAPGRCRASGSRGSSGAQMRRKAHSPSSRSANRSGKVDNQQRGIPRGDRWQERRGRRRCFRHGPSGRPSAAGERSAHRHPRPRVVRRCGGGQGARWFVPPGGRPRRRGHRGRDR